LLAISAAAIPSSTIFYCTFVLLLLFGCSLFARSLLLPSQAKPVVAVKQHRKHRRLKTDKVENDTGASMHKALVNNIDVDLLSFPTNWISDGKEIFSKWPKCQQEAFHDVAWSSDRGNNHFFLTVITLAKLHIKPYRRAETELQEGQFESCLTIEGLPHYFNSFDVGRLLHQIDDTLNALTVANNTVTRDLLHDGSGDLSTSRTAVVDNILVTKPLLDFIERRIPGPPAAQNIFFRRGSPEISV
jgi:hypothetical protein